MQVRVSGETVRHFCIVPHAYNTPSGVTIIVTRTMEIPHIPAWIIASALPGPVCARMHTGDKLDPQMAGVWVVFGGMGVARVIS